MESPIKKKHNSIAINKARESIAAGIIRVAKVAGDENVADLFTKLLAAPKLEILTAMCMWRR